MKTCYLIFLFFFTSFVGVVDSFGQEDNSITITGVVVDELNEPIIHAQIVVVDNNKTLAGTVTDFDGKFSIIIPANIANETSTRININYIGRIPVSKLLKGLVNSGDIRLVMGRDPKPHTDHHVGRFRVPLIDEYSGGHVKTMVDYEIEQSAY